MILVLIETDDSGATVTSLETLTFARNLADLGDRPGVEAVVVGPLEAGLRHNLLAQLGEQAVLTVRHATDDQLDQYSAAAWAASVVTSAEAATADLVLAAGTPRGSEIMAHVAARLGTAMAANVVRVEQAEPLVVSRQVMGGAVFEEMRLDGDVNVMTVAGHAVDPKPADSATSPDVLEFSPSLTEADLVTRVVRVEAEERDDTSALSSARVVVGAGRGAGSADGFDDLIELTELLGGVLGASRVVTSLGWRPHAEQVGQTGSRIAPDVYIACGISGAIQHWAGCQGAKTIVAINTDADAPMVTKADYAIIGDLHEIVPAINAELRRRLG
ncbi:electron transfer flavoprotein subunit alpha/FixB family protein [Saxibacter everestensis]|uniref:Electron transfer flavoprotein subunit alpha/FixB family protein n=1 Tax=Saxibacter everestensis TaxID=2909229 RepID=A0ABY8QXK3_9MICO|nr:electron transfer flavoprotein subunit alpha/FixB family protein [Brevibacteriaceae bacterium ZFBP1038]